VRTRTRAATAAVATALALSGCGDGADYANDPRPPTAINVTAAITDDGVSISPRSFGAGPVVVLIANETAKAQTVTIESAGDAPGIRQRTTPINPEGTTTLKLDIKRGRYRVSVDGDRIAGADLRVGAERDSSSGELLTP